MNIIALALASQILFSLGDLLARANMSKLGFTTAAFISWWFLLYFSLRTVAMFIQLYILSTVDLGKTAAIFAAAAIIVANVLGFLVLKEVLSPVAYIGVILAITAILVISLK